MPPDKVFSRILPELDLPPTRIIIGGGGTIAPETLLAVINRAMG